MVSLTREGMIRGLGLCVLALGLYMLANIATLTHTYVNYYNILENSLTKNVGFIWLNLIFQPLSGGVIGATLAVIGIGMLRLRNWARILALGLMCVNLFALVCWISFTRFEYISPVQLVQVLAMYGLITALLNLKWIKAVFS